MVIDWLDTLERACDKDDHIVFFHLREIVLDLVRHARELESLAASSPTLDRTAILRQLDDLHSRFEAGTLEHWQGHLAELESELGRRVARHEIESDPVTE